jgi:hypothetical protein
MTNIIKNVDNRGGSIIQTTIIRKIILKPGKWFKRTFWKKSFCAKLSSNIYSQLETKINIQKSNRKYIPAVFLELNEIKESLRYLTQPFLFYNKELNELLNVKFIHFNTMLERMKFPKAELLIGKHLLFPKNLFQLECNIAKLKSVFKDFLKSLPNFDDRDALRKRLSEDLLKLATKEQGLHRRFGWFLGDFEKRLDILNKRLILLTERAGQGKTNLICDFIENVFLKKKLFGVMFFGNEFNNLDNEQIETVILKSIYGYGAETITFNEFLRDVEVLCKNKNAIFTIFIDGLNENSNIEKFSDELYKFTETVLKNNYIRLVYTCRSEYFEERFKAFNNSSFKNDTLVLDNYMSRYHKHHEKLPDYLQKRLVDSYFDYFQVKNIVFDNVKRQIAEDFLLLRIFCEVYGNKYNPSAVTDQVYDIYKDYLFKKYFEFKKDQIAQKSSFTSGDFKKMFEAILKYMITNHQYINIPFNKLNTINICLLNHVIEEDIFLRKDLVKDVNSIFANEEVLNFTFDEFRDFLLADYLVNSDIDIASFYNSISTNDVSIEGIEKYLFFMSRKLQYRVKLSFLEKLAYFDILFINNIFSVQDIDITSDDINKIKVLFISRYAFAEIVIHYLMFRHRNSFYKNLNIFTLFDIITTLTSEQYNETINKYFRIGYDYYTRSRNGYILHCIDELSGILESQELNNDVELHNVFEFMFLLLGVEDEHSYGKAPYELVNLLECYIDKYQNNAKNVMLKHCDISNKIVQIEIWKLMNYYVEKYNNFDKKYLQTLLSELEKISNSDLREQQERFLIKCYRQDNNLFLESQQSFFISLREKYNKRFIYAKPLLKKYDI